MSLPYSLAFGLQKLNGYSTQYFRLETTNLTEVNPYGVITLNLPVNVLCNLKSLSMHCKGRANNAAIPCLNGAAPPVADTVITTLPNGIEKLISRVEIYSGGVAISSGMSQYSTVSTVLDNLKTTLNKEVSYQRVLKNQEINVNTDSYYQEERPYILNNFLQFIGESSPDYLDTALLPSIQLRFYMHGPEVLGAYQKSLGAGVAFTGTAATELAAKATWQLTDLHFTIETITFSNGVYDSAVERKLKEDSYIEMPFTNYFTFQDTQTEMTKSNRFSLSAQSLDMLYAVQRPSDYNSNNTGLHKIDNKIGATYVPSYFRFYAGDISSWQYNVNSIYYPNYRATPFDAFNLVTIGKADNYSNDSGCKVNSLENWYNSYWTAMLRLNMPMPGMGPRNCSGIDTRGLNSSFFLQTQKSSPADALQTALTNNETFIIAQCTSIIRIGMGRMIEVVV